MPIKYVDMDLLSKVELQQLLSYLLYIKLTWGRIRLRMIELASD
jgi:hypothetical protein